jgi:hypothetical protein
MNDRYPPSRRQHPSTGSIERRLVISCDDCAMQCTSACDDCVVSYLLRQDDEEPLVLDRAEERAVRLLAKAGMIPELQYQLAV